MEWRSVLAETTSFVVAVAMQILLLAVTVPVYSDSSPRQSGRVLRITTVLLEPYMMARYIRGPRNNTIGVEYEGFVADLVHELSKVVGFQYQLYVAPDNQYGFRQPDGTWNGMVKELIVKKADIAAGAMLVTKQRKEVVNFTTPFLNVRATILVRKPPDGQEPDIRSAADLVNQSAIAYGTLDKGIIPREFKKTNHSTWKQLWKGMTHFKDSVFTVTNEQGISRARSEQFAFVIQDTIGEYIAMQKPCDLITVDKFLFNYHYALALRKDSVWLPLLNRGLRMLERGHAFDRLYRKWWVEKSLCETQNPSRSISLAATSSGSRRAMSTVFFILHVLVVHNSLVHCICTLSWL